MVRTATKKKIEPVLEQVALPIEDASIEERQVTIRVLTVGTRQITQTLFRQLIEEDVIDGKTGNLNGEVWGWVNLHDKDCEERVHLHVIWQDGGELKRSYVLSSSATSSHFDTLSSRLHRMAPIYVSLVALDDKRFVGQEERDRVTFGMKGRKIAVYVPSGVRDIWRYASQIEQDKDYLAILEAAKSRGLKGILQNENIYWGDINPYRYTSHHQVYQEMEEIATELNLLEQNYANSYKKIKDAGQLFVAVSGVWK